MNTWIWIPGNLYHTWIPGAGVPLPPLYIPYPGDGALLPWLEGALGGFGVLLLNIKQLFS